MKNRKILIIAIVIAIIVTVVGVLCYLRITDEAETQSDGQALYLDTFADTDLIVLTVIKVNEGFVNATDEQVFELLSAYSEIVESAIDGYKISKDGIKRFNNSVKDIFGSEAVYYLIDEQTNRDPLAWYDGLIFNTLEYEVCRSDNIPEEIVSAYLETTKDLYFDLSHEKVEKLSYYLYYLLVEAEGDYDNSVDNPLTL